MNENEVYAFNKISRQVDLVPESYLEHPIFGPNLELVRNGKDRIRFSEFNVTDTDLNDPATAAVVVGDAPKTTDNAGDAPATRADAKSTVATKSKED